MPLDLGDNTLKKVPLDLGPPIKQEEPTRQEEIEPELSSSGESTIDLGPPSDEEPGAIRTAAAGADVTPNDVHSFAIWLESNWPTVTTHNLTVAGLQALAKAYNKVKSGEHMPDMTNAEWASLKPEDRRKILVGANYERAKENFPDVIGTENEKRASFVAGKIVGSLASPTIAFPMGSSYKSVAATGAMLGAADVSLSDYVTTGKLDPYHIALGAVGGAVFAPAILAAMRGLGKGLDAIDNIYIKQHVTETTRKANELIDIVDDSVARKMAERTGEITPEAAAQLKQMYVKEALKDLNVSMTDFNNATLVANRKTRIPTTQEEARALVSDTKLNEFAPGGITSDIMQPISDRLLNISKPIWQAVRNFDMQSQIQVHGYIKRSEPFFKELNKLSKENQRVVSEALINRDFETVKLVFKGNKAALDGLDDIAKVHDEIYDALVKVGYKDLKKLPNYFHREIRNIKGLMAELEPKAQSELLKAFASEASKKGKIELTSTEKAQVANKFLRGFVPKEGPIGASKDRGFEIVPANLMKYYADPKKAYHSYIRQAVNDIHKKELFGRNLIIDKETGALDLDRTIDESLGELVSKDPELLKSTIAQMELKKLLLTRFSIGEQTSSDAVQMLRNIGYTTTLGNPIAAMTQAGDIAVSMYRYGIVNALKSLVGKKYVNVVDYGIIDIADELASSPIRTAKFLQTALRLSGFNTMDRLGKNTHLNSAYRHYSKLAESTKGIKQIEAKYQKAYGDEFPELIKDLRSGEISERVKLLLFHELADIQPISKTEMPVKYLQNPNGRIFYMLKSFTIKQLNLMKRDGLDEIRKGNVAKGVKNLTTLLALMTAANSSIDVLKKTVLQQDISEEDLPDMVVGNIFKNFGASEWIMSKGNGGKIGTMLQNTLNIAPLGIIDAVGTDLWKNATNKEGEIESLETAKQIPYVGKLYYYWFGPGAEQELRKEDKKFRSQFKHKKESRVDRLEERYGVSTPSRMLKNQLGY